MVCLLAQQNKGSASKGKFALNATCGLLSHNGKQEQGFGYYTVVQMKLKKQQHETIISTTILWQADNSVKFPLAIPNRPENPLIFNQAIIKNENKDMWLANNSVIKLPISNPKPDLHNINAHTKFD